MWKPFGVGIALTSQLKVFFESFTDGVGIAEAVFEGGEKIDFQFSLEFDFCLAILFLFWKGYCIVSLDILTIDESVLFKKETVLRYDFICQEGIGIYHTFWNLQTTRCHFYVWGDMILWRGQWC